MTETLLDSFRSSLSGWLRGTAFGLGTILLGIAGFAILIAKAGNWGAWPLLLTLLALVIVFAKWLQTMAAKYELTAERLIVRRGIIFKSIDEIELYRIKDVRIDFTLLNQWVGLGTITITSSDETTRINELKMRHIGEAQARRETLRRLVDTARRQRGVREIDMVHEDL
ncbi:MAG: PH domain-containing protein [Porphyrobacter sp.]|nr:PH domain-containing protein [Porphyrobacter sp.]